MWARQDNEHFSSSYDYTLKMETNRLKIIYHVIEVQALHEQQESNRKSYGWEMNIDRISDRVQEMQRKY